jgi:hypothetical protein
MTKIVAGSADILLWLNEHHKLLWARSKFSADIKCDYINNNLAGARMFGSKSSKTYHWTPL